MGWGFVVRGAHGEPHVLSAGRRGMETLHWRCLICGPRRQTRRAPPRPLPGRRCSLLRAGGCTVGLVGAPAAARAARQRAAWAPLDRSSAGPRCCWALLARQGAATCCQQGWPVPAAWTRLAHGAPSGAPTLLTVGRG
eukprot:scaffold1108_cov387-Prasinococcus_capsulatus_cf.AAC.7